LQQFVQDELLDGLLQALEAAVLTANGGPLGRDPHLLETSAPGIFTCGDVRLSPVKRVVSAVGERSMAIAFVHQFLRDRQTAEDDSTPIRA
jgi:thioredoxin reductase